MTLWNTAYRRCLLASAAITLACGAEAQDFVSEPSVPKALATALQARSAQVNDIMRALSGQLNRAADPHASANELALSLHKLGDGQLARAADFANLAELQAFLGQAVRVNVHTKALADQQSMVFVPLTPCRIADSRVANSKLTANAVRGYYSYSAPGQGGNPCASNPIMPNGVAGALAMTVTATQADKSGWLTVSPDGATGTSSALNFGQGADIANSTVVQTSGAVSSSDFYIASSESVHVLVDVLGYYTSQQPAALECVTVSGSSVNVALLSTVTAAAPSCASGFTQTATYCHSDNNGPEVRNVTPAGCTYYGLLVGNVTASASCCRVPAGR